jgi:predicted metal-dependent enzyme (double-stranded beta helix superfamily)
MTAAYGARECAGEIIAALDKSQGDIVVAAHEAFAPMQHLMDRPDLLTLGVDRLAVHSDLAQYLYYDRGLMITISQFREGAVVPVHDHGTWECVGVYRGSIDHTLYREKGDGRRPGDAPLEVAERKSLSPLEVIAAVPPETEVHGFTVTAPETLLLVVVGGQYKPVRRYFQVSAGTFFERAEKGFRAGR